MGDGVFRKMLAEHRDLLQQNQLDNSPWLELQDENGSPFFYDFSTNQSTYERPAHVNPPLNLRGDLQSQSARRQYHGINGDSEHVPIKFRAGQFTAVDVLSFTSWWTEEGIRRYLTLQLTIETCEVQLIIQHTPPSVALVDPSASNITRFALSHLTDKHGNKIECWHLHVGAKLNILGKPCTLLQCEYSTAAWLKYQAARLLKLKKDLTRELLKYEMFPAEALVSKQSVFPNLLSTNLMNLIKDNETLRQKLSKYRPAVAAKFNIV
eukprot:TRINITY_DN5322_c0_g1_i5.p1 TRINITY_DN5322_c0_g1~~TRINITY_DN5322_c0_g1_i5.p1  ORF type:complete len:275 (-),score=64.70 TRINITY_DN5322_c0_g1_i5:29-826(-)